MEDDTKITPWEVTSTTGIDYMMLIKQFGVPADRCRIIAPF